MIVSMKIKYFILKNPQSYAFPENNRFPWLILYKYNKFKLCACKNRFDYLSISWIWTCEFKSVIKLLSVWLGWINSGSIFWEKQRCRIFEFNFGTFRANCCSLSSSPQKSLKLKRIWIKLMFNHVQVHCLSKGETSLVISLI